MADVDAPLAGLADHLEARLSARTPGRLREGKRSAVLILLYERVGEPHVVLTRRADTVAHHRGQVCLPGGRFDVEDGRLLETAMRETREELGIPTDRVRVLGRLDDVSTRASGFIISPFVGHVEMLPPPRPNPAEIARVIEVPVATLLEAHERLPPRPTVETLRYPLLGEDVWGATARILHDLCQLIRSLHRVAAPSGAVEAERPATG